MQICSAIRRSSVIESRKSPSDLSLDSPPPRGPLCNVSQLACVCPPSSAQPSSIVSAGHTASQSTSRSGCGILSLTSLTTSFACGGCSHKSQSVIQSDTNRPSLLPRLLLLTSPSFLHRQPAVSFPPTQTNYRHHVSITSFYYAQAQAGL